VGAATDRVVAAQERLARFGAPDWTTTAAAGWLATLDEYGVPLEEAAATERRLAADRVRLGELGRSATAAREALEQQRTVLARATTAVDQAEADVRAGQVATAARTAASADAEAWAEVHRLATDLSAAQARCATLRERAMTVRESEQDARETFLAAQQARVDGMAAELAGRLVDGEPCAVCGSRRHPLPTVPGAAETSAVVVERAEQEWQSSRSATAAVQGDLAAAEQLATTRTADLADAQERHPRVVHTDLDTLAGGVAAARSRLEQTSSEVARLGDVETRLARAHTVRQSLVLAVDELERTAASAAGTAAEVQQRVDHQAVARARLLDEHQRLCPCASPSVEVAVSEHERVRAAAVEVRDALTAADEAESEAVAVEASGREALTVNGFETVEDATTAALRSEDLVDLRRRLRDLEQRRAAAEATLADPEVAAALDEPDADVGAATSAADSARAALRRAQHAQTGAEAAVRTFGQVRESVLARVAAIGPLAARSAQVAELADTTTGIGGQNTLRMRLTAFVLAARLEKVAALANERLRVMGDGRYQLAHSDDLAAGGRRSGLGLVVRDQWTGQVRDTASLSGGESFMASLALALGLADAVREEAGGFDLNTLFIDEGFGTLDDESLEQVMAVLDGLRDGGRCVGVVSHVSDLRSRVPAQVRVDKTSTGSSVAVLGLDNPAA
jgi:exonuclease SbcC